jgi:hypothetical protein
VTNPSPIEALLNADPTRSNRSIAAIQRLRARDSWRDPNAAETDAQAAYEGLTTDPPSAA